MPRTSHFIPSQVASATSHPRFSRRRAAEKLWICGPRGKHLLVVSQFTSSRPTPQSIITYVLLCGYSPFRSQDIKVLMKETTEAKIEFHDRYWKSFSSQGMFRPLVTQDVVTSPPISSAKNFILDLLNPDSSKRLTAAEALQHPVSRPPLTCLPVR